MVEDEGNSLEIFCTDFIWERGKLWRKKIGNR